MYTFLHWKLYCDIFWYLFNVYNNHCFNCNFFIKNSFFQQNKYDTSDNFTVIHKQISCNHSYDSFQGKLKIMALTVWVVDEQSTCINHG